MRQSTLAILFAFSILAGCRSMGTPTGTPESGPPRPGDIIAVENGAKLSFAELMSEVSDARVVYVGEQHNNDYQHAFQARVVEAMFAQSPDLVIAMEMFQRPYQEPLSRFVAGEIDEAAMLRETEYFTRWGWDYNYYRPILLFAREHRIPVVAMNSPAEVNRKVAREGLGALTPEEQEWIAKDVDLGIEAHREYVQSVFGGHPLPSSMKFENFYASQCIWEDTMAESVARGMAEHPGSRVVVIVGGGHVQQGFGIPLRAAKRGAKPYAILYGVTNRWDLGPDDIAEARDEEFADYFYVTKPAPAAAPTPKLGVMLGKPQGASGIPVTHVMPGGIAALAGIQAGDRIVAVNGDPTPDLFALKLALTFMEGRMGTFMVARDGGRTELCFDRAWAAP